MAGRVHVHITYAGICATCGEIVNPPVAFHAFGHLVIDLFPSERLALVWRHWPHARQLMPYPDNRLPGDDRTPADLDPEGK